jgi:hypothetical protein
LGVISTAARHEDISPMEANAYMAAKAYEVVED